MDSPLQPDPYAILGLAHGATPEEVRRAYKRLAMRWHPDRNPDPIAHAHFSAIRAAYDRLTGNGLPEDEEQQPESTGPSGESRRDHVTLSLEEAAFGTTSEVVITGRTTCTSCNGTGKRSYSRTTMCGSCFGSGRARGPDGKLTRCRQCDGRGFITESLCATCDGRGWNPADRTLQIQVPPGMLAGETLRLAGQGGPAPEGGQAGDMFVEIRLAPHPLLRLEGRDLHVTVPVSVLVRLTGGTIAVPTLTGLRDVTLAPNGPGVLHIDGAGFPRRGERPAGDLIVHFHTVFPQHLNGSQLNLLRTADRMMEADLERQSPELAEWRRRLSDLGRQE